MCFVNVCECHIKKEKSFSQSSAFLESRVTQCILSGVFFAPINTISVLEKPLPKHLEAPLSKRPFKTFKTRKVPIKHILQNEYDFCFHPILWKIQLIWGAYLFNCLETWTSSGWQGLSISHWDGFIPSFFWPPKILPFQQLAKSPATFKISLFFRGPENEFAAMGTAAGRIYRSRSQAWLRGHDDPLIHHMIPTSFCVFGTKNLL